MLPGGESTINVNEVAEAPVKGSARPTTCRMFENELLEKFSRIHPATPFVVYVPLLSYVFYRGISRGTPLTVMLAVVFAGMCLWTLAEYGLHRSIFHWTNNTNFGKRFHFYAHGVHHDFPNDADRLVMPLLTSVPLAIIFWGLFYFLFGVTYAEPVFVGFGIGYLTYDGTHYAVHHFKQTTRIGKYIKRHHMLHHHMDHDGGFGVSSPIWDLVFGTMPKVKPIKKPAASD